MFKKMILAALVAAPMMLNAQAIKLGALNPNQILQVMPETATAKTTLEATQQKYETQAKALQEEFNKKAGEYEQLEKSKASEAVKEAKQKELLDIQQKAETFRQTAMQDIQKQQEQLMAPIEQKLRDAIQQVGAEGGYSAIFYNDVLLYRGASVEDITPKVKAKLGIK